MEKITIASFFFLQSLAAQILSSNAQPSLAQYLQLAGLESLSSLAPPPPSYSSGYPPSSYHRYPPPPKSNPPQPPLPLPLTAIAELSAAIPVSPQKPPSIPKLESFRSPGLDPNVLNNLAIALQLLIVSNILNIPASELEEPLPKLSIPKIESLSKYESVPIRPISLPIPVQSAKLQSDYPYLESSRPMYSLENQVLPNSNFLGSGGFVEPSMFGSAVSVRPNPRSSMTLMSPYEALGPSSPYSDPVLSSVYTPSYSKKDLQSPYASILAADGHRDLFSVSDLF